LNSESLLILGISTILDAQNFPWVFW